MLKRCLVWCAAAAVVASLSIPQARGAAPAPIHYTFTIPEPQHHWMQVAASFPDLDAAPLQLRMSRSSPGRYSLHEFAKNVYEVHAYGEDGGELETTRPDESGWTVPRHGRTVTVTYRIYGDRLDGTYLAIDDTHLHMNMPAAVMWARGLDDRPSSLVFTRPAGTEWTVATQLHSGATPLEFTAPNLQYLMDSPVEFSPVSVREFTSGPRTFRFALHHTGTPREQDSYVADVEKIVAEEGAIFGEFPQYDPGCYTFLADYLPWANGDGMEHRNSTVMTEAGSIASARTTLLDIVAHEFFHGWNVERIRPEGIEPFDFDRANVSDSLWLAEGFTQYYGPLALQRTGLVTLGDTLGRFASLVNTVVLDPARTVRSAVDMSRMAPFIDGGRPIDRTNWSDTVISYYPFGGAIALALDLSLRARSDGRLSLDDYMREMWRRFGKPGGSREGFVDRPYTLADAEQALAAVSGDAAFAREFFGRYISGRDAADYGPLLARAGLVLRKRAAGRASWGSVNIEARDGRVRIAGLVPFGSPAYAAGLDQDDEVTALAGARVSSVDEVRAALQRHRPGETIEVRFTERGGQVRTSTMTLVEDPQLEIVPAEAAAGSLTPPQRAFRDAWLGPHRR